MTDIIIELSEEDQEVLERYAEAEGKEQEEWAKVVLSATLQRLAKREEIAEATVDSINKAFSLLDNPDEPKLTPPEAVGLGHNCAHLDKEQPTLYAGQCEGTCRHRQQNGRPCYYGTGAARQCPLFGPANVSR